MKRVCVFGGAFDPMTLGHYYLAEYVSYIFDEVWIVPCNAHLFNKKMTSASDRISMCLEYTKTKNPNNNIFVSDYEIKNKLKGTTLELATGLKKDYPELNFSFLIGMDNANNIHKFYEHEYLINNFKFVIANRTGYDNPLNYLKSFKGKSIWYLNDKRHHYLKEYNFSECSSTQVRSILTDFVKSNDNNILLKLDKLLDKNVKNYIINNKLYAKE